MGIFHGIRCIPTTTVDAEQAEALALLEAIKWAKEVELKEVNFEGDCNNVVMVVNGHRKAIHWTNNNIIEDCIYLLGQFEFWSCSFVKRTVNNAAHVAAKFSIEFPVKTDWNNSYPTGIEDYIQADKKAI
ncbi:uncharacterized protein LOC113292926 [Papaver somniferum]|uniref:uncharacterized protein LOC113292926 n=1 Tax=Papaver somniferum TaxID=3469 RepID=UPI000E6F7572|nr:uncharacterized protein LOC113292926 [Papaver somniferum]